MKKSALQKIKKYVGHFATGIISVIDLSGYFAMQDVREGIRNLDKNDSLSQDLRSIAEDFKKAIQK
jgi:hypothetical protein